MDNMLLAPVHPWALIGWWERTILEHYQDVVMTVAQLDEQHVVLQIQHADPATAKSAAGFLMSQDDGRLWRFHSAGHSKYGAFAAVTVHL